MFEERPSRLPGAVVWRRRPGPTTQPQRILPDGCMDLMWYGDRLVVAGPDTTAWMSTAPRGAAVTGVRFPPGTGPSVFGVPARELLGQRVPLADLWPAGEVGRLAEQVSQAEGPGLALERIAAGRHPEPDPLIGEVVTRLRTGATVAGIAEAIGLGERQLHRRSLAAFGYGPKTLERILRLHRALGLVQRGIPFASVAATAGYADQAHLARDVKALAGVPLRELISA
ncbi:MAG: helix-turn-helix domain-containing protein [Micromonosporaceae bacterium]|nr:helix-turn-helix domain-containing protein [Micromonosporaceae bacterium]